MGGIPPGKQKTGFEFEKNKTYHIADCPRCNPQRPSTPVMEHEYFCAANGIPTTTNYDLLQEIEQKDLQAHREAARLRDEFNAQNSGDLS